MELFGFEAIFFVQKTNIPDLFIFKENYPINLISSAEKRNNNELIKYPINTYSSSFLLNIGFYIILKSNTTYNKISSIWLGNIMNILGLFSILWWSTGKKIIRKFDNLFMEIHLLYLSLFYILMSIRIINFF